MSLRICIVSEAIEAPFDEGVKIFVYHLIEETSKDHTVLGISRLGHFKEGIEQYCVRALPDNKLFISPYLGSTLRKFCPDIIFYIPTACATLNSFLRARILKFYVKGVKTVLISLQPREYSFISKNIIPLIAPDLVLTQSEKTQKVLSNLGCETRKIACGVDLHRFTPVDIKTKEQLRKKYYFPDNKYLVLHVGHINRNRNMQFMGEIQNRGDTQAVVVGSTSYPEDKDLVKELQEKGVIVLTQYIEKIEEIYQCADYYIFPVFSDGACIEIPLSVLEAMACNLPVITTEFGGLPDFIPEQDGFMYAKSNDDLIARLDSARNISNPRTRDIAGQFSWGAVIKEIISISS